MAYKALMITFFKSYGTYEWEKNGSGESGWALMRSVDFCMCVIQSKASDMRFDGMFGDKKVQESKRQRVINSRYRGDYIEPVIYRAIME